jgi:hypothetical protein
MANGVITTGSHPKGLWPGIKLHWGQNYDSHAKQHEDLFDVDTSDKAYEEMVELTGFGMAPVKTEGGATTYDTESQQTTVRATHVAYSLGYIVTREELADNKYVAVSKNRATANAFSMYTTKQTVAANIYNRAFTAGYTFGDGQILCVTTHPTLAGNQSNALSVAADLSEASLEDLIIQIMNAKNSRGLQIRIQPQCLVIPTNLFFEANRIVNSTLRSDSANNDINVIKMEGSLPKGIKVNNYLTDTDAWFVRTNVPGGMKMFQREKVEFTRDADFDTDNAKAKSYERYSFTVGDFRSLYGTPGA